MTQQDLFQTATSYPAAILASHLVRPGSDEARKMTAISGRKYLPLLKQKGRVGLFAKMWLDTSVWASTRCYLTWQIKPVTKSRHFALVLWPSMPRTAVKESGSLLHTPTATANQMTPSMRNRDAGSWANPRQMMPTPTASDHIERNSTSSEAVNPLTGKSVSLDRFVKFWPDEKTQQSGQPRMWPTPTANEDAAGTPDGKMQAMLGNHPDVRGTTPEEWAQGSLNPAWVEHYLMGYPRGWTNLETSQE
mgnify:CR=1 FL=1